ncbi:MAG: hypothetical protein ACOY0T_34465 [Myxococcota bacterium]
MVRAHSQTSTMGWLAPPSEPIESRPPADARTSDNWPIPLVVRRESGWRELSAEWFDAEGERAALLSRSAEFEPIEPYQLVSRRRLRLAHALFALLFLGLLALAVWEADVYFGLGLFD